MEPMTVFHLPVVIILLPYLNDQVIRLFVFKPHEIKLMRMGLAGVPYLEEVGLDSHAPPQDQGIEIRLVHPFLDEDRPFQKVRSDVNADCFQLVLGDGEDGLAESLPLFVMRVN